MRISVAPVVLTVGYLGILVAITLAQDVDRVVVPDRTERWAVSSTCICSDRI